MLMTAIFFGFVYFYEVPTNDGVPYSKLAYTLGIAMTTIFLSMLPICMISEICMSEKETIIEVINIFDTYFKKVLIF